MVTSCSPWRARVVFLLLSLTLLVGMSVPSRGAGITAQECQEAAARSNPPPPGCHGRRLLETTIITTQQGQPVCRVEKVQYVCPKPHGHISLRPQVEYFLLGDAYSSTDTPLRPPADVVAVPPPDPLWTFLTTNPYDNGVHDVMSGFLQGLGHVDKPPQMRNNRNYNRGYLVGAIVNGGSNFVPVRTQDAADGPQVATEGFLNCLKTGGDRLCDLQIALAGFLDCANGRPAPETVPQALENLPPDFKDWNGLAQETRARVAMAFGHRLCLSLEVARLGMQAGELIEEAGKRLTKIFADLKNGKTLAEILADLKGGGQATSAKGAKGTEAAETAKPSPSATSPHTAAYTPKAPRHFRYLQDAVDRQAISALTNQKRGANDRIYKIIYRLYEEEQAGGDPAQALRAVLEAAGYTGRQLELTEKMLLRNYDAAKQLGVFDRQKNPNHWQDNLDRLKNGQTATLANGVTLQADHIVPIDVVIKAVGQPEIGTVLANLLITPQPLNSTVQNKVTSMVADYARDLHAAGFLSKEGLAAVEAVARDVWIRNRKRKR
jgi:hypothetical protein